MINLLISSIEIELINELVYLKTKRSRSVFRVTLRLRTEYSLSVWMAFFRLVYNKLGEQLRSDYLEFTLLLMYPIKNSQASRWYGPSVPLRGHGCFISRHACHCMLQSPCAAGKPTPPLSSPWRNLQLSKQISASVRNKKARSGLAHYKRLPGISIRSDFLNQMTVVCLRSA